MSDSAPKTITQTFTDLPLRTEEQRLAAAALSPAERQRRVETLFVDYPLFQKVTRAVRGFHYPVEGGLPGRGQICGILGLSRAGKSWAIRRYIQSLGQATLDNRGIKAIMPRALYIDAIAGWTSNTFAHELFLTLGLRRTARATTQTLLANGASEIQNWNIELVVIDDAQFLLTARDQKTVREFLGFIVSLAERNCCNILLSGTHEIYDVVQRFPHAIGRGGFPCVEIAPYSWLSEEDQKNFRILLHKIAERLPFAHTPNLADPYIAATLYRLSGGLIGKVMNHVRNAAFEAINETASPQRCAETGTQTLEIRHLVEAAKRLRDLNDPFMPFVNDVDLVDPAGELRKRDAEDLASAMASPTLSRRRRAGGLR